MSVALYPALVDACRLSFALSHFLRVRLDDIGIARGWPPGHENEVFKNPSDDDYAELVRLIKHEAANRRYYGQTNRVIAAAALAILGESDPPTRKAMIVIVPPMDLLLFKEQLSHFAYQYQHHRALILHVLDEFGKQGHRDARLYAYALRAWPDRSQG